MPSQSLANLQATVNRWSGAGDFSPIVIDGGMGSETENAVQNALLAACQKVGDPADRTDMICNLKSQLDTAFSAGTGQSYIMNNVLSLTSELDAAANKLSFPPAATVALVKPITVPSMAPDKSTFSIKPPPGMGVISKARLWFRQQSTPVQVGVGAAGVFGVLGLFGFIRKKKGAR